MSKLHGILLVLALVLLSECGALKEVSKIDEVEYSGMEGLAQICGSSDTIENLLIKKAEAILTYDGDRYEANVTIYSKRDSIIYLSAVSSGYEILRASVNYDSIKVIDRMNKIVYHTPLQRRFGYQYPVNFSDLQNLIARWYLCDELQYGVDDQQNSILFEFDEEYIKKRIILNRGNLDMRIFEFYHQRTDRYLMGERLENGFKIYSNFMIGDIEILAYGGERSYNRDIDIKMDVNPRRYTFTELR